ncbi:response regulator [Chitinophaga sp. NPDC101104]|uniref:response regulator n=1 Tax=Chitinophaga sp. NPDC101104 TaxID=3390561 RepID=UPI003CFF2973
MLVDDDTDDQEIFLYALRELNLPVLCQFARDGREALKKLAAAGEKPDYIFLDLNMAPMDGRSCLMAMKADPQLRDIPVIIYSTSSDPRTRDEMLMLGASGYWVKDVSISRLCSWLRSLLEEQHVV